MNTLDNYNFKILGLNTCFTPFVFLLHSGTFQTQKAFMQQFFSFVPTFFKADKEYLKQTSKSLHAPGNTSQIV